ncbi:hypothetical protein XENTR_v10008226 [Xenopus tropicalis]|nr:hypothetical protein XENTR_v10008226 [Xenopus tropicalis]
MLENAPSNCHRARCPSSICIYQHAVFALGLQHFLPAVLYFCLSSLLMNRGQALHHFYWQFCFVPPEVL